MYELVYGFTILNLVYDFVCDWYIFGIQKQPKTLNLEWKCLKRFYLICYVYSIWKKLGMWLITRVFNCDYQGCLYSKLWILFLRIVAIFNPNSFKTNRLCHHIWALKKRQSILALVYTWRNYSNAWLTLQCNYFPIWVGMNQNLWSFCTGIQYRWLLAKLMWKDNISTTSLSQWSRSIHLHSRRLNAKV